MFITLEGIEGSGKTTQVAHIERFLHEKGFACIITREPGGTKIGEKIRAILLSPDSDYLDPRTELLLYMADRVQHVKELVNPSLAAGKTVLCDRYIDATVVYQGVARGLDIALIKTLHKMILDDLKPDITLLLDLAPEIGLPRAWKQINNGDRAQIETRFEKKTLSFHKKVREGYLELARREPDRFKVIDASREESRVRKDIFEALVYMFSQRAMNHS